jgi:hypothetical protein
MYNDSGFEMQSRLGRNPHPPLEVTVGSGKYRIKFVQNDC